MPSLGDMFKNLTKGSTYENLNNIAQVGTGVLSEGAQSILNGNLGSSLITGIAGSGLQVLKNVAANPTLAMEMAKEFRDDPAAAKKHLANELANDLVISMEESNETFKAKSIVAKNEKINKLNDAEIKYYYNGEKTAGVDIKTPIDRGSEVKLIIGKNKDFIEQTNEYLGNKNPSIDPDMGRNGSGEENVETVGTISEIRDSPKQIKSLKDFLTNRANQYNIDRLKGTTEDGIIDQFTPEKTNKLGSALYPYTRATEMNQFEDSDINQILIETEDKFKKDNNIYVGNQTLVSGEDENGINIIDTITQKFTGITANIKKPFDVVVNPAGNGSISLLENFVFSKKPKTIKIFKGGVNLDGETPNMKLITGTKDFESNFKSSLGSRNLGTYRFFIEKLHGKYPDGSSYKKNPVIKNNPEQIGNKDNYNFMNRIMFPAFVDNFLDTFDVDASGSYDFIGRAESLPIYKKTGRKLTLTFNIISDHEATNLAAVEKNLEAINQSDGDLVALLSDETFKDAGADFGNGTLMGDTRGGKYINGNASSTLFETAETAWQKLTFLSQCCYPYFRSDGKMKEQPLIRLRIGDFIDVVGMITSLQHESNIFDTPLMTLQNSSLGEQPMGFKVTLGLTIIHNYEPSSEFYGFYHRKQFDNDPDGSKRNFGVGIHRSGDPAKKAVAVKSPLQLTNYFNENNPGEEIMNTHIENLNKSVNKLQTLSSDLESPITNLNEKIRNRKKNELFKVNAEIEEQMKIISNFLN